MRINPCLLEGGANVWSRSYGASSMVSIRILSTMLVVASFPPARVDQVVDTRSYRLVQGRAAHQRDSFALFLQLAAESFGVFYSDRVRASLSKRSSNQSSSSSRCLKNLSRSSPLRVLFAILFQIVLAL